jgi:hypothetical protein
MEFTLEQKLRAIFDYSDTAKIEKVTRTKGGIEYFKYIWSVNNISSTNWFGFDSLEECLEDCLSHQAINSL